MNEVFPFFANQQGVQIQSAAIETTCTINVTTLDWKAATALAAWRCRHVELSIYSAPNDETIEMRQ